MEILNGVLFVLVSVGIINDLLDILLFSLATSCLDTIPLLRSLQGSGSLDGPPCLMHLDKFCWKYV